MDDRDQIEHLVIDLTKELGEHVSSEAIRREVTGVYDAFHAAKIRQYVPVLTRKIVREHLVLRHEER
jgi:hypothetical protein